MNKEQTIFVLEAADETKIKGINSVADAVKVTLGPKGSNVIIEKSYGSPVVTKDGVTVAKEIFLEDKGANVVAQLMKESSAKTAEVAGDGTTTATVLTQAILIEGQRAIAAGVSPTDIRSGLTIALDAALKNLQQRKVACDDDDAIFNVATISANGDKNIGNIITKAIKTVGKNGTVSVSDGKGFEDELEIVEGLRIDRGYLSPHFVAEGKQTIDIDNAYILLSDKKITSIRDIIPSLEKTAKDGKQLLIVAEDVADDALHTLIINNMRGTVKVVAVKAPGFGDRRKELLDDLAVITGARTISNEVGDLAKPEEFLGMATKVQVRKNDTTFISYNTDDEALKARTSMLEDNIAKASSTYEKEQYQERLAKLSKGVALIKVGGATETEINEKKYRIDDALQATKAAIEEGVVAGGGVVLLDIQKSLTDQMKEGGNIATSISQCGLHVLSAAFEYPIRQILINAGQKPDVIINTIQSNNESNFGYNAATNEYGNMMSMGIIDPTKVTRCAIQTAVSVASIILTTKCIIVKKEDKTAGPAMPQM